MHQKIKTYKRANAHRKERMLISGRFKNEKEFIEHYSKLTPNIPIKREEGKITISTLLYHKLTEDSRLLKELSKKSVNFLLEEDL